MPSDGTKNLIPVTKGSERARLLGKMGGKSKGKAKSDKAKLRHIKDRIARGITNPEDREWMMEKLRSRDACAADIFLYINEIKDDIHPAQRIALGNLMTQAGKFLHGDKVKTENTNLNVNVDINQYLEALYAKRIGPEEDVEDEE